MHVESNIVGLVIFKVTDMKNTKYYYSNLIIKKCIFKSHLNKSHIFQILPLKGKYSLQVGKDEFGHTLLPKETASSLFHFVMDVVKANSGSLLP